MTTRGKKKIIKQIKANQITFLSVVHEKSDLDSTDQFQLINVLLRCLEDMLKWWINIKRGDVSTETINVESY